MPTRQLVLYDILNTSESSYLNWAFGCARSHALFDGHHFSTLPNTMPKISLLVEIKKGNLFLDRNKFRYSGLYFLEEIGRGANAVVLKAHEELLDRVVAVKVWPPSQQSQAMTRKRKKALAEARKIAALEHDNIAKVMTARFLQEGIFALVMEYIEGATLTQYIQSGPDIFERLSIGRPIAEALHYSYSKGIYHGDLHTNNVIISGKIPKLIDFGTSIFARSASVSPEREVRLIRGLFHQLFPELQRLGFDKISVALFSPEMLLFSLNACMSIMHIANDLVRLLRRREGEGLDLQVSDFQIRSGNFGIGYAWCRFPLIELTDLEAYLEYVGLNKSLHYTILKLIFGFCQAYPHVNEDFSFDPASERNVKVLTSVIRPSLDRIAADYLNGDPHKVFYR